MSVVVIVPTFGRQELLTGLVSQLRAQTLQADRILFVDDTPGPEVESVAIELGVDYLHNEGHPSLTRARNLGIEGTTEQVIAFLDSDVQLESDYLARMVALLDDSRCPTVVQAHVPNSWRQRGLRGLALRLFLQPVNVGDKMTFKPPFRNSFPDKPSQISESDWLSGSNMVFRRALLGELRFDENLERYCLGEDVEMGLRLRAKGHVILMDGESCVRELNDETGRITNRDLELMRVINVRYILDKHKISKRGLLWQDIGWIAQTEGWRCIAALRRYIKHRRAVRGMSSPEEWNKLYSFWSSN
jgi:GT2 family glycosyltransferase